MKKISASLSKQQAFLALGQAGPSDVIQHGMSQVVVETVTKTSVMSKFQAIPQFKSDASRVTCEGNGLKKAFRGKQATFNVDTSNAGMFILIKFSYLY